MSPLWGGRFTGANDPLMARFNASLPFDWRLWDADITGSIARKYCGGGHGGYALYLFNNPASRDAALSTTPQLRAVEPFCRV